MAQEDYNLDMRSVTVEISYSLPAEMMMTPSSPPIHVTSDRQQGGNGFREREEAGDNDEAGEWEEDVGDNDEAGEWKKMLVIMMRLMNVLKMLVIMSLLKMKIKMGRRKMGRGKWEEDADNTIVGERIRMVGITVFMESIYVNQSFVSKDALLSELRLTAVRGRFSFRIYKSTKTLLVAICRVSGCGWKIRASVKHGSNTFWVTKYVEKHLCSIGDRIAQRRHCTPKYVGSLFIDRVGIIDGITPQHITDAMKNMFGMTLDYTLHTEHCYMHRNW
ncbi:hypothetical protein Rs2_07290 [Raphanus sativus]|nr:hypothetical protein Rs2_07290 [Raphanus sativus]